MADDAVVRIILEESAAAQGASPAASPTGLTPPTAPPLPQPTIPPAVVDVMARFSKVMEDFPDVAKAIKGTLQGPLSVPPDTLATMQEFIAAMEAYPDALAAIESYQTPPAPAIPPPPEPPKPPAPPKPPKTDAAADQGAILADARSALMALGEKKEDADRLIARLVKTGEQFASVQDAIIAAYRKVDDKSGGDAGPSPGPGAPPAPTALTADADRFLDVEAKAALNVAKRQQAAVEAREAREQQLLEFEARLALDIAQKQQTAAANVEKRQQELLALEARVALDAAQQQQAAAAVREKRDQELFELEAHAALDLARRQQASLEEIAQQQQAAVAVREERTRELLELEARVTLDAVQKQQEAAEFALKAEIARDDRQRELLELEARVALDIARQQQAAIVTREKRDQELLEIEAKVALQSVRDQQAAAKDARKAEIKKEDRERELLEIEARAALGVARAQQEAAAEVAAAKPAGPSRGKSDLESGFDILDSLRGTIGGAAGGNVGSGLDLLSAMRKQQQATAKNTTATVQPTRPGEKLPTAEAAPEMDAAAAALPPIAIAMAVKKVVEAIDNAVRGGIKAVVGGASGIANFAADAGSDPSVPIGKLGDAASDASEQIRKVSPALGWVVLAAGETTKAFSTLMQNLDRVADRYGEYNAQIASAQAIAEVRQTVGDLRRAQEIGPEMAQYIQAQSDLQQKIEDVKIKLLMKIVPAVTRILEMIEGAMSAGQGIENAVNALLAPLMAIPGAIGLIDKTLDDSLRVPIKDPTEMLDDILFQTVGRGDDTAPGLVPRR